MSLSETTRFSSSGGQTTHLTVLVNGFGQPLSVGISSNSLMSWIDQDHFEEFISRILTNPIAAQHTKTATTTTNTALKKKRLRSFWIFEQLRLGKNKPQQRLDVPFDFSTRSHHGFLVFRKFDPWSLASYDHHDEHEHDKRRNLKKRIF